MALSQKVLSLRKQHDLKDISSIEIYMIKGRLFVGSVFAEKYFNVSPRQVNNWQSSGLKTSEYSIQSLKLFDLKELLEWHSENINKNQSKKTEKARSQEEKKDESNEDISRITSDEAERRLRIAKLHEQEMKNRELAGELIRADDSDIAMAEQAVIHLSQLNNDKKMLPIMLEMKDREEIAKMLDEHFKDRVDDLHKIVNKVLDASETIIDLIYEAIEKIKIGVKMSFIMELIRNSHKGENHDNNDGSSKNDNGAVGKGKNGGSRKRSK